MGFVGLIPPGLINMTTVRNTIDHGSTAGIRYAGGASIIVFVQASIALVFANYFKAHPELISNLKSVGVLVFFILGTYFFYLASKKLKKLKMSANKNFFIKGMLMSSMNMLSLPFYLGWSSVLQAQGVLTLKQPYIILFVLGASGGAFTLFYLYSLFAKTIQYKANFIARNINYILSVLFFVLGSMTLRSVMFL